jgi:cell filamentation protein
LTTPINWRWSEKDFGFRFKLGKGRSAAEYYQAGSPDDFYTVSPKDRKLAAKRVEELSKLWSNSPTAPRMVANPWRNYTLPWDWIVSDDKHQISLNYAGCLDPEEVDRREDEGVARAQELINDLVQRAEPVRITVDLCRQVHTALMGEIYPFAGEWRTVHLHKGDGMTKWPLPPCGIEPMMLKLDQDVLSRTPFLAEDNGALFAFLSQLMNEFLALHPFREGNGRTAFILASLVLMQNDLLPLDVYDRRRDEARYFAACEAGRVQLDYKPLAVLLEEWEEAALQRWKERNAD